MLLFKLKEKYLKAKNSFERAQALYVAAKEMQIYAEDNLEMGINSCHNGGSTKRNCHNDCKESLLELLENAKKKVQETEQSKQKYDIEQIEATRVYDECLLKSKKFEKEHKRAILKSKQYYELKAEINKELKFQLSKIEGLKSCLKEAKSVYQQSLNNLETISSEIHIQRQLSQQQNQINEKTKATGNNNNNNNLYRYHGGTSSNESSAANTQSLSIPSSYNRNNTASSTNDEDVSLSNSVKLNGNKKSSSSSNSMNDISIDNCCISDEQILNLSLDSKLYKYKQSIKLRPQFRASLIMKTNV